MLSEDPHDSPASRKTTPQDELFRLLVEQVKDYAIFLLDADGFIASWNKGAELVKGYRSDEILGQPMSRFYTEEDKMAGRPAMLLNKARREGRVEDEGWRLRKDGTRFWADVVITPLIDETGVLRGYAKVTRNLTERRQHEEDLQQARRDLERRVHDRTAELHDRNRELEQFHDAAVGRELRMIELENEIEHLRREVAFLKRGSR